MSLTLHGLKPGRGSRVKKFRIGRGPGSGRGTTAGRGTKGQRARSGGRNKLRLKGMKQMLLAFPKLRGFTSHFDKPTTLSLARLEVAFAKGGAITLQSLKAAHVIHQRDRAVRIVGNVCTQPFQVQDLKVSVAAKAAIEKAGGSVKMKKAKKTAKGKKGFSKK